MHVCVCVHTYGHIFTCHSQCMEVRGQKLILSVWVLGMELSYQVLFPAEPSRPSCAAILNVVPQTYLCMCFP